jgi:hypothetical protein
VGPRAGLDDMKKRPYRNKNSDPSVTKNLYDRYLSVYIIGNTALVDAVQ